MKRLAAGFAINFVLVNHQVSSSFLDIVGLQHLLTVFEDLRIGEIPSQGFLPISWIPLVGSYHVIPSIWGQQRDAKFEKYPIVGLQFQRPAR